MPVPNFGAGCNAGLRRVQSASGFSRLVVRNLDNFLAFANGNLPGRENTLILGYLQAFPGGDHSDPVAAQASAPVSVMLAPSDDSKSITLELSRGSPPLAYGEPLRRP